MTRRHDRYKVVTGVQVMAVWQGPRYPNNTGLQPSDKPVRGGKFDCGAGCLFDLGNDPTEYVFDNTCIEYCNS